MELGNRRRSTAAAATYGLFTVRSISHVSAPHSPASTWTLNTSPSLGVRIVYIARRALPTLAPSFNSRRPALPDGKTIPSVAVSATPSPNRGRPSRAVAVAVLPELTRVTVI